MCNSFAQVPHDASVTDMFRLLRQKGMSTTEGAAMFATWVPHFVSGFAYFAVYRRAAPKWNRMVDAVADLPTGISLGQGRQFVPDRTFRTGDSLLLEGF